MSDQLQDRLGLGTKFLGGGGGLFGDGSVGLSDLVHLEYGGADCVDGLRLLFNSRGDVSDEVGDFVCGGNGHIKRVLDMFGEGVAQEFLSGIHRLDDAICGGAGFRHSRGGALGFLCAASGEVADLVSHDGKPHPSLASSGGLDGGVKGEQVGLERDFVDGFDVGGSLLCGAADVRDCLAQFGQSGFEAGVDFPCLITAAASGIRSVS